MTKPEARKVAKRLAKHGFKYIMIVEDFETGEVHVTAENRCNMRRVVLTTEVCDELINTEGNGTR